MARTVLVFCYGLCKHPAVECCITVGTNAFPNIKRKTSLMVLLAMYRVCDYIFSDVSGGATVSYHCLQIFKLLLLCEYKPTPQFNLFYFVLYIRLICEYIR